MLGTRPLPTTKNTRYLSEDINDSSEKKSQTDLKGAQPDKAKAHAIIFLPSPLSRTFMFCRSKLHILVDESGSGDAALL